MSPAEPLKVLGPGDAALGRLDVLPTLDGMDEGLLTLGALVARGVAVLNEPLGAACRARQASDRARPPPSRPPASSDDPRPRPAGRRPALDRPLVVKPRFGKLGGSRCIAATAPRSSRAHFRPSAGLPGTSGTVRSCRSSCRRRGTTSGSSSPSLLGGSSARSTASPRPESGGRTSRSEGYAALVVDPPRAAAALALAAAEAVGIDLAGVDLLPDGDGGWVVAELNGAVEFTQEYAAWGDVFAETSALPRPGRTRPPGSRFAATSPCTEPSAAGAATLLPARRRSSVG